MTDNQTMSKPREGYLELKCEGMDSDGNSFMECDMYFEKRNDTDIHVIEYTFFKTTDDLREIAEKKNVELRLQLEAAKAEVDSANASVRAIGDTLKWLHKDLDAEKQRSAKLVEALNKIDNEGGNYDNTASNALAEYSAGNESSKGDGNA